ncbi:hypothetical protein AL755_17090 [Arthrobacter sp. ERGS1:01]|uniref:tetratricopeptide repeat protein n=1 Tax=Arthrobacter sp. ERGS1:01 TaxID=1704044 RepID=UPI0006B482C9|nr:tetratricopeptide repeat protein [Arthrobacter sp. ERGS1:01]ALE06769.1 hypothetical protein AL755_17090 [Arthrobacter sp. ERGS1:01]
MKSLKNGWLQTVDLRSSIDLILADDPDGLFNTANDLQLVSKNELVETLYLMAIDRGVVEASLNLGLFLRGLNRDADAIPHFHKAHELGDRNGAVALGQSLFETGSYADAVRWLKTAGDSPHAPLWLARAYRALGDPVSATRALRDGCAYSPEAAVELAMTTSELSTAAAIELLERHLAEGEVAVLIPLANLYSLQGDSAKEIELLRRSVAAGELFAMHNLGVALTEIGESKEGFELLRKAAAAGDKMSPGTLRRLRRKRRRLDPQRRRRH